MARVEVQSTIRVGHTQYEAGQVIDMSPDDIERLPPGVVKLLDPDNPGTSARAQISAAQRELAEIDKRVKKYASDKAYVESQAQARKDAAERLAKLESGAAKAESATAKAATTSTHGASPAPPGLVTPPPVFGYAADSPVDVVDPKTGKPYADSDESPEAVEARAMRLQSIIDRQDQRDLRHPSVQGIPAGSAPDAAITEPDGSPAKLEKATHRREDKHHAGGPVVATEPTTSPAGVGAATVVTAVPAPGGPKVPDKK